MYGFVRTWNANNKIDPINETEIISSAFNTNIQDVHDTILGTDIQYYSNENLIELHKQKVNKCYGVCITMHNS